MASLTLEHLEKRFGNTVAVKSFDLTVQDGEFFALLGPSGCGKTTTMRMIAGLEAPTSGRILIRDRDVTALGPADRNVGMVFQDYALYPHMTVKDNIGYPLKVRNVRGATYDERIAGVAQHLHLSELLGRRPGQLSGGQQQRAAVARAVVHQADVFLFDEPLSNLDAKLRLEARTFLKRLQRELNLTIIYVTHDQVEALALADRMAVMKAGEVQQVGPPMEVYRSPANTFVASFLGSPPMNLLEIHRAGQGWRLGEQDLGELPLPANAPATLTLGIRPEHLHPSTDGPFHGQLINTEFLGAETILIVKLGEQEAAVRLNADAVPPPTGPISLALDWNRAVYFEATGERWPHP